MEELEESVWSVVRQENEREDQGEGVQNSGNTSTGVRGRDTALEKLDKIRNERIRGTTKVGEITKIGPGKEVEVVWACDEKRGTLCRKEGDGNEIT